MPGRLKWIRILSPITALTTFFIAAGPAQADLSDIYNEAYYIFFEEHYPDVAWEKIKDLEDSDDPFLYVNKALMQASGRLTSGFDRCGAIINAEKAAERGNVTPAHDLLRGLYEGEWISIAALEGSRLALYYKGYRLMKTDIYPYALDLFDDERSLKDAAPYLYLSAELGYEPAIDRIRQLETEHPEIFERERFMDAMAAHEPIQLYCPPRTYLDGELR